MKIPRPEPRSLSRYAAREKVELALVPRSQRLLRQAWATLRLLFLGEIASLFTLGALSLGIAFIPWGVSLRPLRDEETARTYLQVLWQVEAATLALSLAVIIFVFQAVYASRLRGSLRSFAEAVGLFPIIYVGVTGLALTGMVLLGGGRAAPGGWAATWAIAWAAGTLALLASLFVRTLRAIDPRQLHRRRLEEANNQVERATERVIHERVALVLLRNECEAAEIDFAPVLGQARSAGAVPVRLGRAGYVRDVRLRRLRRAGREASALGLPRPALLVRLGSAVGDDTPVAYVEPPIARQVNLAQAFRLSSGAPDSEFRDTIEQLHDEAIQAIRTPSPSWYAEIISIYSRLLLGLPETWAKYGQQFGPEIAAGHPFEFGFLDFLERNLYDELKEAALGASREVALEALNLPIDVAARATKIRAIALSGRMLRLYVAAQRAILRSPPSEAREELGSWSRLRLSEYGHLVEALITEDEEADKREYGKRAALQLFEAYAALAKAIIDADPRDGESLGDLNGYWTEFLQHWHPEREGPDDWEIELLEQQHGANAPEIRQARERASANRVRAEVREEIDEWRRMHRFALCFWALYKLRTTGEPAWVEVWNAFAGYLGDVSATVRTLDRAIQADFEDRGRWSDWVLEEMPRRTFHGLAIDLEFLQTFIILALNRISPDGPAPEIEPLEWVAGRLDDVEATVRGVVENEAIRPLLPEERLDEGTTFLVQALEEMRRVRLERDEQAIIDSPLHDEAISTFTDAFRAAWNEHRLGIAALRTADAFEQVVGEPDEDASEYGFHQWMAKSLFVRDSRVGGRDDMGTDLGEQLAQDETKLIAEKTLEAPELVGEQDQSFAERVRAAIAELRAEGFEPTAAFIPLSWRLLGALELELTRRRGGEAEPPGWVPAQERDRFVGVAEGVPVFEVVQMRDDKLAVVALGAFVHWRQWMPGQDESDLEAEIVTYDAEQARALAEENPQLFRAEEREAVEARAREIQKAVRVKIVERFKLDVVDEGAARWLEIPEDLRRG